MQFNNNDQSEPLTGGGGGGGGGGDDSASQSSQRSGASLLERIRSQREREAAVASAASEQAATPSTIQVPQYSQVASSEESSRDPFASAPNSNDSSFFHQAWTNISNSMEMGMASLQQEQGDLEASDALLPPTTHDGEEEHYSIIGYFLTFVRDVYETFLNLPLWVRIVVVFALLYTALKLM
eukprot:CAMPEP_0198145234 /NCGR_PEP_ID=MMETSP1443-20131203/22081_1 /TAXON_ID=186043 /ORGANISM="Entomoneis sp., Strain CCMP2396" /LENGTH=181 /DNA_ID=CAMNT_0043808809 /DNA_START=52 /DNA_END=597 /DNA_ORIENTATION=+